MSVLLENIPLVKFIKLHPGPEWFIFHNLTREFIDDIISVIVDDHEVLLLLKSKVSVPNFFPWLTGKIRLLDRQHWLSW